MTLDNDNKRKFEELVFHRVLSLIQKGYYEQAGDLILQILHQIQKTKEDIAGGLLAFAQNSWERGYYDFSEVLFDISINYIRKELGPHRRAIPNSLMWLAQKQNSLALRFSEKRNYSKAEWFFLKAMNTQLLASGKKDVDYASVMKNLGGMYYTARRYKEAESYLLGSKKIYDDLGVLRDPKFAVNYSTNLLYLGLVKQDKDQYSDAQKYYSKALDIYYSDGQENDPYYKTILNAIAGTLQKSYYKQSKLNGSKKSDIISKKGSLSKSRKILEHFQLEAMRESGVDPSSIFEANAQYRKKPYIDNPYLTEEDRKAIPKDNKIKNLKPLTKYEYLSTFSILTNLVGNIEKVLSKEQRWNSQNTRLPLFGTLMSGDLNATSRLVGGTKEYLLLFETEIFTFCYLISKIVATCLPSYTKDGRVIPKFRHSTDVSELKASMRKNREAFVRLNQLVMAFITSGVASYARQYFIGNPYLRWAEDLTTSMELFIVGHEYSHVSLGHLRGTNVVRTALIKEKVPEIIYDQEMEYDADFYGLTLMLRIMTRYRTFNPIIFCGPELFFSSVEIVQNAQNIFFNIPKNNNAESKGSHPPTYLRRKRLRKVMEKTFGDQYLHTSKSVETILKVLWDQGVKRFLVDFAKP